MNLMDTLSRLNRGSFNEELEGHMADVLDSVQATGKAGSVTITIDMALDGQERDRLKIGCKMNAKLPQPERGKTTMFVTQSGNLVEMDPKQSEFGSMRAVDVAEKPLVDESPVKKKPVVAVS